MTAKAREEGTIIEPAIELLNSFFKANQKRDEKE